MRVIAGSQRSMVGESDANGNYVNVSFGYDFLDRRISKYVDSTGASTVWRYNGDMIWLENDNLYNGNTGQTSTTGIYYLNGDGIDQWQARQVFLPGQSGPATLQWFLSDRMGSVQAVTDANGGVLESYSYSAFGVRSILSTNSSLQTPNALGFTGREHDAEMGLMYYRARYMDPGLGRFISEDPISFGAGDFNLLRYAANGPENWIDPFGHSSTTEESFLQRWSTAVTECASRYVKGLVVDTASETVIYLIIGFEIDSAEGAYSGRSVVATQRAIQQARRFFKSLSGEVGFKDAISTRELSALEQYSINVVKTLLDKPEFQSLGDKLNRIAALKKEKYAAEGLENLCGDINP